MKYPKVTIENGDVRNFGLRFNCHGMGCGNCALCTNGGCAMDVLEAATNDGYVNEHDLIQALLGITNSIRFGQCVVSEGDSDE